jgi:tetratricopeptide (TPR) repeat protein
MNLMIATSEDPAISGLNEKALETAEEFYDRSLEYEKSSGKEKFSQRIKTIDLQNLAVAFANRGFKRSETAEDALASTDFKKVFDTRKKAEPSSHDSTSLFNAALLAEKAGDPQSIDNALNWNQQLIDMGYNGITYTVTDVAKGEKVQMASRKLAEDGIQRGLYSDLQIGESVRDELYKAKVRLYKSKGDMVNYKSALAEARKLYPDDEQLLRIELQEDLDAGNFDSAMRNLDQAIAQEPENPLFYYVKGFILQTNLKKDEEAIVQYDKAIELNPVYLDALYMKGTLYVNRANLMTEEMNKLPLSATKKYNQLKADQTKEFEKALPLFERAHQADPKDTETIKALKEVYYRLGKLDKSKEMNDLLGTLN